MFENKSEPRVVNQKINIFKYTSILIIVLISIFLGLSSYTVISGGERGVIFSKASGVSVRIMNEGFNLKVPFIETVIRVNVRSKKSELKLSSTSKDQQIVDVSIALIYRVDDTSVNKLYQEIGMNYKNKIIDPVLEDRVKEVMANFKAEELIQKRNEVSIKILKEVRNKLIPNYIIVEKLNILDIIFSESYNQAIELKVVAEQQEQKAKNDLERIKIEAEQVRTQAQAEADANLLKAKAEAASIKIQQEALTKSKEILQLRWIEKWNGVLPQVQTGEGNGLIINLDK